MLYFPILLFHFLFILFVKLSIESIQLVLCHGGNLLHDHRILFLPDGCDEIYHLDRVDTLSMQSFCCILIFVTFYGRGVLWRNFLSPFLFFLNVFFSVMLFVMLGLLLTYWVMLWTFNMYSTLFFYWFLYALFWAFMLLLACISVVVCWHVLNFFLFFLWWLFFNNFLLLACCLSNWLPIFTVIADF